MHARLMLEAPDSGPAYDQPRSCLLGVYQSKQPQRCMRWSSDLLPPCVYYFTRSIVSAQDHGSIEVKHDEGPRNTSPSPRTPPRPNYPASQNTRSSPPFPLCMRSLDDRSSHARRPDAGLRGGLDLRVIVSPVARTARN